MSTTMRTCSARPGRTPRTKPTPTAAAPGAPRPAIGQAPSPGPDTWLSGAALAGLLVPLCDATDALARLDARAAAAPDAVRDGLRARMATAEAAGWLAHAHAWVHPLDLVAPRGRPHRQHRARRGRARCSAACRRPSPVPPTRWTGPTRRSTRWPTATAPSPTRSASSACSAGCPAGPRPVRSPRRPPRPPRWQPLGAGELDPARLAAWWTAHAPAPPVPRRYGSRAGEGTGKKCRRCSPWRAPPRAGWRPASPIAPTRCTRCSPPSAGAPARDRRAPSSCRSGPPIRPSGFPARDALPGLRSDAADRVAGRGRPVTWPLAFLHLVAESARMALRELDRLEAAAEQGRGVVAGGDKRSRLPDALDALLRVPALTPKALAARLKVAPQTGTALLRELQGRGVVREVTGRGSFRAFAI